MAKLDAKQLQKEFSESLPKRKEAKYAKDLLKEKRKALLESEKKQFKKAQNKELETGVEAESRLLKQLKETRNKISTSGGDALYPGDFPDPEIQKINRETVRGNKDARESYMASEDYKATQIGERGTPTRIANKRMDMIKRDLKTSQSATKAERSFSQQDRVRDVQEKQKEFAKIFTIQGVDPRKIKYLTEQATNNYIMQKYGTGK
tara:strand:+ start:21318 stop:21935 length:618 start_codon:yes stop_codon:yes gene_type:complete